MVFLGVVFGFFTAFVNEPPADKGIQHLTADEPLFEEIGIPPPHGLSSWRQDKFLGFRFFLSGCCFINHTLLTAQKPDHGLWVTQTIVVHDKGHRTTACFDRLGVVEPLAAPYCDTLIGFEPFFRS